MVQTCVILLAFVRVVIFFSTGLPPDRYGHHQLVYLLDQEYYQQNSTGHRFYTIRPSASHCLQLYQVQYLLVPGTQEQYYSSQNTTVATTSAAQLVQTSSRSETTTRQHYRYYGPSFFSSRQWVGDNSTKPSFTNYEYRQRLRTLQYVVLFIILFVFSLLYLLGWNHRYDMQQQGVQLSIYCDVKRTAVGRGEEKRLTYYSLVVWILNISILAITLQLQLNKHKLLPWALKV